MRVREIWESWQTRGRRLWAEVNTRANNWPQIAYEAYAQLIEHEGFLLAAAIAYYAFFSLFPLAILSFSFLGAFFQPTEAQQRMTDLLGHYLPRAENLVQINLRALWERRAEARLIALISLAWTGSSVFAITGRLLDRAWGVRQRGRQLIWRRLLALPIAVLGVALLAVSLVLSAALRIFSFVDRLSGMSPLGRIGAITFIIAVVINIVVFALVYWVLPSKRLTLQQVLPGAIVAAISWELAKNIYTWYLSRVWLFKIVYGSVTAVIITLTWIYITSCILLYCGELNAAYDRTQRHRKREAMPYRAPVRVQAVTATNPGLTTDMNPEKPSSSGEPLTEYANEE